MGGINSDEQFNGVPDTMFRKLVAQLDLETLETGIALSSGWDYRSFQVDSFFRLYYVVSGKVDLQFSEQTMLITAGNFYLIPANIPFRYVQYEPLKHYWIHFRSSLLERLPEFRTLHVVPEVEVVEPLDKMKTFFELAGCSSSIENVMRLDILLRQLLIPFISKVNGNSDSSLMDSINVFSLILDYIEKNLHENISIPFLADMAHLPSLEFSAEFFKAFGLPPKQYLVQRRIDRAKVLLVCSDKTIKEIAAVVGYDNEFFFYRIFKKYTGLTPTEYRRRDNVCR